MKFRALLAMSCGLMGSITAQDSARAGRFMEIGFPEQVDIFTAMRITRWPIQSAGVGVTFISSGIPSETSIYIYSPAAETPTASSVKLEFDNALESIRVFAQQNREGVEVTLGAAEPIEITGIDGSVYIGWRGQSTMTRGSSVQASQLYLFSKANHLLKYRVTYPLESGDSLAPHLATFLSETLGRITVP